MIEKDSSSDKKKEVIAKRSLTPAEQQRIQALRNRTGEEKDNPTDFFKLNDYKDGQVFLGSVLKEDLPYEEAHEDHQARGLEATGFSDFQVSCHQLSKISRALCNADTTVEASIILLNRIGHYMKEFRPKDAIEGTLCAQIIVCQERGLELLGKACSQSKSPEWARTFHNASSKLFARAQAAIQALVNYRRGGQQTVKVEHVHVEAGGQAAFGTFQAGGGGMNEKNYRGTP